MHPAFCRARPALPPRSRPLGTPKSVECPGSASSPSPVWELAQGAQEQQHATGPSRGGLGAAARPAASEARALSSDMLSAAASGQTRHSRQCPVSPRQPPPCTGVWGVHKHTPDTCARETAETGPRPASRHPTATPPPVACDQSLCVCYALIFRIFFLMTKC